jgi:hypothetical protein
MRCEDFPCCGHEPGCCPNFDEAGRQTDMVCTCGARLPITSRYSICEACLRAGDEDFDEPPFDDEDFDDEPDPFHGDDAAADADALASAGWGTDEDYGGYEDFGDYWGD